MSEVSSDSDLGGGVLVSLQKVLGDPQEATGVRLDWWGHWEPGQTIFLGLSGGRGGLGGPGGEHEDSLRFWDQVTPRENRLTTCGGALGHEPPTLFRNCGRLTALILGLQTGICSSVSRNSNQRELL